MSGLPYFTYKGISSLDHQIVIVRKNTYAGAQRDLIYTEIPGRSGDLLIDNARHKNVKIRYDVTAIEGARTIPEIAKEVKNWLLQDVGYFPLTDSYDPEYFRLASYGGPFDLDQSKFTGDAKIEFNCKPYRYSYEGQSTITLTEAGTVTNPECFPSAPYFKITGSGSITLTVNDISYPMTNVSGYIEVDSESMNVYKDATSMNRYANFAYFPSLKSGDNAISWSGSVTKVEIIPRWCCL